MGVSNASATGRRSSPRISTRRLRGATAGTQVPGVHRRLHSSTQHGLARRSFPDLPGVDGRPIAASLEELDLAGIGAVIWATGYRPDLGWVRLPVLDTEGYPIQCRGVTTEPGLYFLGLDWMYKRSSGLFGGMSDDAIYLASVIATEQTAAQ